MHNEYQLIATFSKQGTLTTATGALRHYVKNAWTINQVRASAGTAPTGASILVDVNKNGTTIWATQGNRVAIAASANTGTQTTFDTTALAANDYLTVDIDQIGSTIPGSDITVQVWGTGA